MSNLAATFPAALATVRARIAAACAAAGRDPATVRLLPVTKNHPAEAVAWLANTLGRFGIPFRAGELILSGSLAPLIPARAGDRFEMEIDGLGRCSVAFS